MSWELKGEVRIVIEILKLLAYVDEVGQGACGVGRVERQDGCWETFIFKGGRRRGHKEKKVGAGEGKKKGGGRNQSEEGGK